MNRVKVAVTGAAGQIGYALLFRLASGQVFGPDVTVDLNLIEIEPALPALSGVVMELQDCAFKTLGTITPTADLSVGFKGVHYALLVGAVPRKKGMERSDLLKINGGIFTEQGRAINDHADRDVKVLVVGNPCNTNSLIAMNAAPSLAPSQFYAMTTLDQNRAVAQLAIKAGVKVSDVTNMIIWGNHSATQVPDFCSALIKGALATEVITDLAWFEETFVPTVQKRGAAIIEARGASSAASAANAIIESVQRLHFDSAGEVFSMCCHSDGQYGVDEGLIYSFPCINEGGSVKIVEGAHQHELIQQRFNITLEELRAERAAVTELALI